MESYYCYNAGVRVACNDVQFLGTLEMVSRTNHLDISQRWILDVGETLRIIHASDVFTAAKIYDELYPWWGYWKN